MRSVVAIVGLGLVACGAPNPENTPFATIDTIGGVEIVSNASTGTDRRVDWSVDTEGAVLVGTLDGPEETRFGRLSAVAVAPNGHVFAADGHALSIRVFLPNGDYVRSTGREGEGPGKFRSIDGLVHSVRGDAVYVRDPLLDRISVFDSLGEFRRSFQLARPFAQISRRTSLWVDSTDHIFDLTQIGTTMTVDSIGVVSYTPAGEVVYTTLIAASIPGASSCSLGRMVSQRPRAWFRSVHLLARRSRGPVASSVVRGPSTWCSSSRIRR